LRGQSIGRLSLPVSLNWKSPAPVVVPAWMNWLINLSIAAVLGAAGFAFYWLVVR
jgi:hypothetical protein